MVHQMHQVVDIQTVQHSILYKKIIIIFNISFNRIRYIHHPSVQVIKNKCFFSYFCLYHNAYEKQHFFKEKQIIQCSIQKKLSLGHL